MDSDHEQNDGVDEAIDMQFDNGAEPSGEGGDDAMIGFFKGLNIVDITEVFSPPRVVKQGELIGLRSGSSMDLLTGWNFELKADMDRAIRMIEEQKPNLVIGSHLFLNAPGAQQAQPETQ